jgi:hypothetical protein
LAGVEASQSGVIGLWKQFALVFVVQIFVQK